MFRRRLRLVAVPCLLAALVAAPAGQALYDPHPRVVSADPHDSTPHVKDGKILDLLPLGDWMYVAGTFTQVKNAGESTLHDRRGLFRFSRTTMKLDPDWVSDFEVTPGGTDPVTGDEIGSPRGVHALAASEDGEWIYAGGNWGGGGRKLVKLAADTGLPAPGFNSGITSAVKDVILSEDRLFAAGNFSSVNDDGSLVPRSGLAALDPDDGSLLDDVDIVFSEPRQNAGRVEAIAITPDGETLVAGGNFTRVDGLERWQVALVDVSPGRDAEVIEDWHTSRFDDRKDDSSDPLACASKFDTHIKDMDMSPDGSYFVIVTTGGYTSRGPLCDTASRWETTARGSDLEPTWANYDGGDTFTGVAITGAAVYVSGHMRWLNNFHNEGSSADAVAGPGAVPREGIAALDPASGLPLPWDPGRERGHGAEALVSTAEGLWVGSDTNFIGGEFHEKLAFFPLAGGAPVPVVTTHGLPADLYSVGAAGVARRFFDGSRLGDVIPLTSSLDWSKVRGAFTLGNRLYTGDADGRLLLRSFDGAHLGQPETVNLRGLRSSHFPVADVTGMFYDQGRLYFTLSGSRELHYRAFLPGATAADDIVGDQTLDADGGSVDWSKVRGMTMAGGRIYWAEAGRLRRVDFADGKVSGSGTTVSSSANLDSNGLFLMPQTTAAPTDPIDPPPADPGPGDPGPGPGSDGGDGPSGYWMVGRDGRVYAFGDSAHLGDAHAFLGGADAVDLEPTPSYDGYWIIDDRGRVYAFGDAPHHGNADPGRLVAGERVTSLSATRSGNGYWVFTSRGRVLPHGDATWFGDMADVVLNGPVLDSIPTPSGKGYYMVASDGGIFSFGDAAFWGSMGGIPLNAPVQSLVPDPDGRGYWLVASDGGIFAFAADFHGSMGATPLNRPMTGMVAFGNAYLMVAEDGGIFNYATDKPFLGSLGANPPAHPVTSVAALDG